MARLDPAVDVLCEIEGPVRYLSNEPMQRPQQLLFDKLLTGQGIFADPDQPVTITLQFPAGHRIQCIQLLYAGLWADTGVPEVILTAIGKDIETTEVGRLPAITQQPAREPFVQQLNFPDDTETAQQEWRELALHIPQLPPDLGLVEMRLIGYDAGLRRIANAANAVSQKPEAITPGIVSQIAAGLRARRISSEAVALRDELVERLSALTSELAGVRAELVMQEQLAPDRPVSARLGIYNDSPYSLDQAVARLRLPPEWRAAPARVIIEHLGAGKSVSVPITIYPALGSNRELSGYLYGAFNGEPLFVLMTVATAKAQEKAP